MKINKTEKEFDEAIYKQRMGDLPGVLKAALDLEFEPEEPEPEVLHEWEDPDTGRHFWLYRIGREGALQLDSENYPIPRRPSVPRKWIGHILDELARLAQERKGGTS